MLNDQSASPPDVGWPQQGIAKVLKEHLGKTIYRINPSLNKNQMSKGLTPDRLNRVGRAKVSTISEWKEGVSIAADANAPIDKVILRVAAARWHLADQFRKQAKKLMPPQAHAYRSAVSRYYYAMYHSARACVYIEYSGDDHEDHSKLPAHIPKAMDPGVDWQTKLKDARLARNNADYDAYPKSERHWKLSASRIEADATNLLAVTKQFLKNKGCTL